MFFVFYRNYYQFSLKIVSQFNFFSFLFSELISFWYKLCKLFLSFLFDLNHLCVETNESFQDEVFSSTCERRRRERERQRVCGERDRIENYLMKFCNFQSNRDVQTEVENYRVLRSADFSVVIVFIFFATKCLFWWLALDQTRVVKFSLNNFSLTDFFLFFFLQL